VSPMPLNWPAELLAVLACPKCKGELEPRAEPRVSACRACGLFYAVSDGFRTSSSRKRSRGTGGGKGAGRGGR